MITSAPFVNLNIFYRTLNHANQRLLSLYLHWEDKHGHNCAKHFVRCAKYVFSLSHNLIDWKCYCVRCFVLVQSMSNSKYSAQIYVFVCQLFYHHQLLSGLKYFLSLNTDKSNRKNRMDLNKYFEIWLIHIWKHGASFNFLKHIVNGLLRNLGFSTWR